MTNADAKDSEQAGTRAGGNVEVKGASKTTTTPPGPEAGTRAGGNVEVKGGSRDEGGPSDEE